MKVAYFHGDGIKWHKMALFTKIRIRDDATSYKKSVKNGVICAKACKNPIFPGQTMPFSGKAPAPLPTVRRPELNGIKWQQMALVTKIRIWDDAISYKISVKNGVICSQTCKTPIFPGQTVPFSEKAPALVILAAAGIQSPDNAPTRLGQQ